MNTLKFILAILVFSLVAFSNDELAPPKVNGLLQTWAVQDDANPAGSQLNFRLRRAEIKLSGSIVENTRYFVMIDPAKSLTIPPTTTTDNKILQDLGIGFTPVANFEILMGQFKIPTTAEGLMPSAELILPERSIPGRTYGDKRKPGLMFTYTSEHYGKLFVMVSNGQGTNVDAGPNTKDLNLRYEVKPIAVLKVGAFLVLGDFKYDKKGSMGANAEVTWESLVFGGEVGTDRVNGAISKGFETHVVYAINEKFQVVGRFELYEATQSAGFSGKMETLGVNYHLLKNRAKIALSGSSLQNINGGANGSPVAGSLSSGKNSSLAILAFQMAF